MESRGDAAQSGRGKPVSRNEASWGDGMLVGRLDMESCMGINAKAAYSMTRASHERRQVADSNEA